MIFAPANILIGDNLANEPHPQETTIYKTTQTINKTKKITILIVIKNLIKTNIYI